MARARRLLAAALSIAQVCSAASVRLQDDTGARVELAQPARRIVSLAPHLTELVFALGAGEHIVGTVAYSDHPDAARRITRIGDASALDLERIVALRPDLVVAWASGNPHRQVTRLDGLGFAVYRSEPRRLQDVARSLEALGALIGKVDEAEELAGRYRERLARLRSLNAGVRIVPVFYQVWPQPLLTVSDAHVVSDALRLCGARNVFGSMRALVPAVSLESVLAADPAAIVTGVASAERGDPFAQWRRWSSLRAVAREHLIVVSSDQMHRHTPRILDAVEGLCARIASIRDAK